MIFETVKNFESKRDNCKKRKGKISDIHGLDDVDKRIPRRLESIDSDSFYNAIKPAIIFGKFFGLFPINGIMNKSSSTITFKIKSFKTYYSIFVIITILFLFLTPIIRLVQQLQEDSSQILGTISNIVFFGNTFMGALFFFFICPSWIKLQQIWTITENKLNSFADKNLKLRQKFMTISLIMMGIAFIEHSFCYITIITSKTVTVFNHLSGLYNYCAKVYNLKSVNQLSDTSFLRFMVILFVFVVNEFCTIIWNFSDIFIILVSTGLAERYKHLNESVLNLLSKNDSINWQQFRKKYALLSYLVKETDDIISPLILLSYFTNLYFICIQLFNGLYVNTGETMSHYVYFLTSFIIIVVRIFAVTLAASRIHNQSKIILPKIYSCSSSSFSIETERLQYQLTLDEVALTGMKFFSITRNFMVTLISAIITYELIILQFAKK